MSHPEGAFLFKVANYYARMALGLARYQRSPLADDPTSLIRKQLPRLYVSRTGCLGFAQSRGTQPEAAP